MWGSVRCDFTDVFVRRLGWKPWWLHQAFNERVVQYGILSKWVISKRQFGNGIEDARMSLCCSYIVYPDHLREEGSLKLDHPKHKLIYRHDYHDVKLISPATIKLIWCFPSIVLGVIYVPDSGVGYADAIMRYFLGIYNWQSRASNLLFFFLFEYDFWVLDHLRSSETRSDISVFMFDDVNGGFIQQLFG